MTSTNLRPYAIVALALSATLPLSCGSSSNGSPDGSGGGSGTGGGGDNTGGTSNTGGSGTKFDAGTDANRNMVAPGGLCQRVAEIQCAGEAACCSNPGRDVQTCTTAQQMACAVTLSLDAAAMDSITGFDMMKSNAALAKFETLASTCDTTIAAFGLSTDGFRGIAAGTVAPGGVCTPAKTGGSTVAATAAALASCTDPTTNACLPAKTGDWKCTPRADAGGACFTDANCKDGLYCDNPGLELAGSTCAQRKAEGADCALGNECASLACSNKKCVAQTKDTAYCLSQ